MYGGGGGGPCRHLGSIFWRHNSDFRTDFYKNLALPRIWGSFSYLDLNYKSASEAFESGFDSILLRFALMIWHVTIDDERSKYVNFIKLFVSGFLGSILTIFPLDFWIQNGRPGGTFPSTGTPPGSRGDVWKVWPSDGAKIRKLLLIRSQSGTKKREGLKHMANAQVNYI